MENIIFLADLAKQSATHFLCSGLAGFIAFCSTQIILFAVFRICRGSARLPLGLNLFMVGLGLFSAFIAAYCVHVGLDAFLDWWTTPLANPLILLSAEAY